MIFKLFNRTLDSNLAPKVESRRKYIPSLLLRTLYMVADVRYTEKRGTVSNMSIYSTRDRRPYFNYIFEAEDRARASELTE